MKTKIETLKSKRIRVIIAKANPTNVAFFCCILGNLFADIEINIILSIPKIISKKVSVNSATQVSI